MNAGLSLVIVAFIAISVWGYILYDSVHASPRRLYTE